jgi:hypothetical protein
MGSPLGGSSNIRTTDSFQKNGPHHTSTSNRNDGFLPGLSRRRSRTTSEKILMTEMEQARKAGGSGKAFTTAVVLAIIACAAVFVWRFLF